MNFPDLGHLIQLQDDLWHWPKSRAAVMVGAGLSLNADPLPGATSKFPTWRQLVRKMFDTLNPPLQSDSPEFTKQREERFSSANFLRIASEYEAAFTKAKLDSLILEMNPDSQYVPGKLHRQLMDLPWADVFTTNYDTLLERTEVDARSYQVVTKPIELTSASSPRVIKLHGSFPAQTPFVISEEDYRKYPSDFSPFVNTVQQSLLENSFVLIGFSGDDPNFLAWTGWIRDELGDAHAPIYLVGPLSLGNAQRTFLNKRGVTPVDLSPLFAGTIVPDGIHSASLEWFLGCLAAKRPLRPEIWPSLNRKTPAVSPGLPPLVGLPTDAPEISHQPEALNDYEILNEVLARWKLERENYPGWVVAREGTRSILWQDTKRWIRPICRCPESWAAEKRILLFREIVWRFEIIMAPLLQEMVDPFMTALDEILAKEGAFSDSDRGTPWLVVAFAIWRDARESYDQALWEDWKAKIDRVLRFDKTFTDRRNCEVALWATWQVDRPALRTVLLGWQPSNRSPLAMMWKAGLLAELDEIGEARGMLRTALVEIRRSLRVHGKNIELLSIEGWCMFLIGLVELSGNWMATGYPDDEFRDRWHELKAWDCNPWPIKEYFDEVLSRAPPKPSSGREEIIDFDPGQSRFRLSFAFDELTPILPAFAYIRMFENTGVPMRVAKVTVAGDALKNACRWLARTNAFWSPAILVRSGRREDLSPDFLNRPQVARIEINLATRIYRWCLTIFQSELRSLAGTIRVFSGQQTLLDVSSEVLSRLSFRVGPKELIDTFPIVLQFHQRVGGTVASGLNVDLKAWFRRLFEAADEDLLLKWLPELIRTPLVGGGLDTPNPMERLDAMQQFPFWRCKAGRLDPAESSTLIPQAIDWLLNRAIGEIGEARRQAIERLICVYRIGRMSQVQQKRLGELLWDGLGTGSIPNRPGSPAAELLDLPSPASSNVISAVKTYILALPSTGIAKWSANGALGVALGPSEHRLILEATVASKPLFQRKGDARSYVEWTYEEARQLFNKAIEWWNSDKAIFDREKEPVFSTAVDWVRTTGTSLGAFLTRVLVPHFGSISETDKSQLRELITDLRLNGTFPTLILPCLLVNASEEIEGITATIFSDLTSKNEQATGAAAATIRHWICLSAAGKVPPPPESLLKALVEKTSLRQRPGLCRCLDQVTGLVTDLPEQITSRQAELLVASLIAWDDATALHPDATEPTGEFYETERPDYRMRVGWLAAALFLRHKALAPGQPEPKSISHWRDLCASDPLPEVRRAFSGWCEQFE